MFSVIGEGGGGSAVMLREALSSKRRYFIHCSPMKDKFEEEWPNSSTCMPGGGI